MFWWCNIRVQHATKKAVPAAQLSKKVPSPNKGGDWGEKKRTREVTKTQCPGCHGHSPLRMEKVSNDTAGNGKMEDWALSLRLSKHSLFFSLACASLCKWDFHLFRWWWIFHGLANGLNLDSDVSTFETSFSNSDFSEENRVEHKQASNYRQKLHLKGKILSPIPMSATQTIISKPFIG